MAQSSTKSAWWKAVLGEYPTGVTLITSLDDEDRPVGMVVGTFCAVSQDPPLIGFFPDKSSSTFPQVAARGRFCASVLGSSHEKLCRAFARKDPDRFSAGRWTTGVDGIPRLTDAVAWFEGEIRSVTEAGDHQSVIADVLDFGSGASDAGLPLIFLRGGYGSFTVPSLQFEAQAMAWQLRVADLLLEPVTRFAEELDAEAAISGLVKDSVVVLSASNITRGNHAAPIGVSFPFAAPLAPAFAAWGPQAVVDLWLENSRHLLGSIDRPALTELLETTRRQGYAVSTGEAMARQFEAVVENPASTRSELATLWSTVAADSAVAADGQSVSSVQVPVFDNDGQVAVVLALTRFDSALRRLGYDELISRLLEVSRQLTARISGQHA